MKTLKGNTMIIPKIDNWYCFGINDPYCPPECLSLYVCGEVYGHSIYPNGHYIKTSAVKQVDGRIITTQSGHEYWLGIINKEYKEYVENVLKRTIDENNPITMKST
jgi:hypothetical protein